MKYSVQQQGKVFCAGTLSECLRALAQCYTLGGDVVGAVRASRAVRDGFSIVRVR